ncbi:MAG TPA: 50S ribosomal protein L2 [Verrucomicrobiae bacterium]|nr:50S ribosomal protein L2 [Verrucomicrobiae bacterium]
MGLRTFRPLTPSLRWTVLQDFAEVTKRKPEKSLTVAKRKTGGRNNLGRMTARGIGGGHKQRYRIIDFKRNKIGVPATVEAIEYDPNRSARIALLKYKDGEKRYIIAPMDLKVGATVMSGPDAELSPGNALPLKKIAAVGTSLPIHNIELKPGKGGQLCRSAAMAAQITASEGEYVTVKLPSGEVRKIHADCYATIGQVGNPDHMNVSLGKAGRNRWLGRRGITRGMARNPVDHPMGGGQGKSKGGGGWHHPCSPWGKLAKGGKSRRKKKYSNAFILERRKK